MISFFTAEQKEKSAFIQENPFARLSDLFSNDIKALITAWCYYSGKIEGNTYTLVETDLLLNDNITSPKDYGDAKMLKNLQNAFAQELFYINKQGNKEDIDLKTLLRLHRLLTDGLVNRSEGGEIRNRAVTISGTSYISPKESAIIQYELNNVLEDQQSIEDPIERSVFLHCNIARIQPFIDGNKRSSRLMESLVLMNADLIPVYSVNTEDIQRYRKALIHFYETKDYSLYADYSLDRQIQRINELAPAKYQYGTSRNIGFKL